MGLAQTTMRTCPGRKGLGMRATATVRERQQEDDERASAGGRWHEDVDRRATARVRWREVVGNRDVGIRALA